MPGEVQDEIKTYQMFINGEWVAEQVRRRPSPYTIHRPKK